MFLLVALNSLIKYIFVILSRLKHWWTNYRRLCRLREGLKIWGRPWKSETLQINRYTFFKMNANNVLNSFTLFFPAATLQVCHTWECISQIWPLLRRGHPTSQTKVLLTSPKWGWYAHKWIQNMKIIITCNLVFKYPPNFPIFFRYPTSSERSVSFSRLLTE